MIELWPGFTPYWWNLLRFFSSLVVLYLLFCVTHGFRSTLSIRTVWRVTRRLPGVLWAHTVHWVLGPTHAPQWTVKKVEEDGDVSSSERMRLSLATFHFKTGIRVLWWDMAAVSLSWLGILGSPSPLYVALVNVTLNCMAIMASLLALWSLHGTIPHSERWKYNLFTARKFPWEKLDALQRAVEPEDDPTSIEMHRLRSEAAELRVLKRMLNEGRIYEARAAAED